MIYSFIYKQVGGFDCFARDIGHSFQTEPRVILIATTQFVHMHENSTHKHKAKYIKVVKREE